jgi:hypothetical protein
LLVLIPDRRQASDAGEFHLKTKSRDFHVMFDEKWRSTLRLKYVGLRLKSIKIYGICLWMNRNLMHHFSFYLYSAQTSNVATWSGFNFKRNVKVVLFKRENLIKTIWWLSVTYIACRNHLGSLSYRQLVSMPCGMQLCHLVLHPPWSIDHFPKHRNSLSFGTHQWCFLTSTINDTQACTRKRIFHWEKEEGIFLRLF